MKIVLLGAGNVASHIGKAFSMIKGYPIAQVYSRTRAHAQVLAKKLGSTGTHRLSEVLTNADLYLICIPDDQIPGFLAQLATVLPPDRLVMHTAGSVSIKEISPYFENAGVLYPLQTFSSARKLSFQNIPLLISCANPKLEAIIVQIVRLISDRVISISDEDRKWVHLCAVMVNNFSNALFDIAFVLMASKKQSFQLLVPLIHETVAKLDSLPPVKAQTGPAKRKDKRIIDLHKKMLKTNHPEYVKMYDYFSSYLLKRHAD
jgi:predicted short-subunit dehydrogenase-like oxidoreductase (DUF2520 family)